MSAAQDPQVSAWEARPADPDGCVERMARAMWAEQIRDLPNAVPWEETYDASKQTFRRLAVAALQSVKDPAGDPHTAVQRGADLAVERGLIAVRQMAYDWYCPSDERLPRVSCRECIAAVALTAALSGGAQ